MKKLIIIACIVTASNLFAQVNFTPWTEGSLKDVVQKEDRIESKAILLYAYEPDGRLSKSFEKKVLEDSQVSTFINKYFKAIKVDIYTEAGNRFYSFFEPEQMPATLLLSSNFDIYYQQEGFLQNEAFISLLDSINAIHEQLTIYKDEFDKNSLSTEELIDYSYLLFDLSNEKYLSVSKKVFSKVPNEALLSDSLFQFASLFLKDTDSKAYQYLIENRKTIIKKYGEENFTDFIDNVAYLNLMDIIISGKVEGIVNLVNRTYKYDIDYEKEDYADYVFELTKIYHADREEWYDYIKIVNQKYDKENENYADNLYVEAAEIIESYMDPIILEYAFELLDESLTYTKDYDTYSLYAYGLFLYGNCPEAIIKAEKALELASSQEEIKSASSIIKRCR